ncbi:hypothetical protein M404DRAFT_999094 [Pisolithus tinctorius Marx 270]|uniref:Uncharacterized protein n=1 Tax=Pisolithus tinctorius Marx 270 TaxID=870435 RepID=A0A0C3KA09_PISTI|nr:hypothetical protein M404DRAFT_999094 [Pisolithus tinctorius Marx 270]
MHQAGNRRKIENCNHDLAGDYVNEAGGSVHSHSRNIIGIPILHQLEPSTWAQKSKGHTGQSESVRVGVDRGAAHMRATLQIPHDRRTS